MGRGARVCRGLRVTGAELERTKEVIEAAVDLGLKALTLYAFSTENWRRPSAEVTTLMKLLEIYLTKELEGLIKNDIVFRAIGEHPEAARTHPAHHTDCRRKNFS